MQAAPCSCHLCSEYLLSSSGCPSLSSAFSFQTPTTPPLQRAGWRAALRNLACITEVDGLSLQETSQGAKCLPQLYDNYFCLCLLSCTMRISQCPLTPPPNPCWSDCCSIRAQWVPAAVNSILVPPAQMRKLRNRRWWLFWVWHGPI